MTSLMTNRPTGSYVIDYLTLMSHNKQVLVVHFFRHGAQLLTIQQLVQLFNARIVKTLLRGKGRYSSSYGNPISELWDVTCRMRLSVTCHPTQVNAPRLTPAMQAGTRFTYPRGLEG